MIKPLKILNGLEDEEIIEPIEKMPLTVPSKNTSAKFKLVGPFQGMEITRSHILILGGTNTGKSTLFINILKHNRDLFNEIFIVCPTLDSQDLLKGIVDNRHQIGPGEVEDFFESLIVEQKKPINKSRYVCVILDDVIGSVKFRSQTFDRLITGGRHSRISLFIVSQDLMKISAIIRQNVSVCFVTKIRDRSMQGLYDMCGFNTFRSFSEFMNQNMKNYQVIKFNLSAGYDTDSSVQVFKPPVLTKKIRFTVAN